MKEEMTKRRFLRSIAVLVLAVSMLGIQMPGGTLFAETAPSAWDGETVTEPAKSGDDYQISTAAELALFAAKVNDGSGKNYRAVLTEDIDLGDKQWTPIGTGYSKSYSGTFSGNGHEIKGLRISGANYTQAALFGYVSNASISGIEVSGSVEGSNNAMGGLVSRSDGNTEITNCGSSVDVTNNAASGKAAGIAGWADGSAKITGCYNRGSIVSGDRASGITADTGTSAVITDCYNAGRITGNKACGVGSSAGITYRNCYNAGEIVGTTSAYGIGSSNYGDYGNTYVLAGTAANSVNTDPAPTEISAVEMKKASFAGALGTAFKVDVAARLNGGYPILSWEKSGGATDVKLGTPTGLRWVEQPQPENPKLDMLCESYKAAWNDVTGADTYTVKLYEKDAVEPVFTDNNAEGTEYDFYDFLAGTSGNQVKNYEFTVTANGDGEVYKDSDESERDESGLAFDPAAFIGTSERLMWNEASKIAVWQAVPGADMYIVTLYRGDKFVVETVLDKKLIGSNTGNLSVYFLNNMALEGDYHFTVRACKTVDDEQSPNKGKTVGGKIAKSDSMRNDVVSGETIKITSAEQWMSIVNMKAAGTEYITDADRQRVEWSKNYVLENDLDFSKLSTTSQADTKSWGNVDAHFTGTFDGQGHKITGLTLSNHDAGLFEYIGKTGVVKNLTVENANLLVSDNAAVFAHYNYGKMQNCHVLNTNITTDYAGIIGPMASRNFGLIEDCTVQGGKLISRTTTSNGHSGFCGNNTGTIKRCWTSMDLSVASYNAGGFCGWSDYTYEMLDDEGNYAEKIGRFEDCFALGNVDAAKGWSGGFIGRINTGKNSFKNCYAAGSVTSSEKPERSYGFVGSFGGEGFNDVNGAQSAFVVNPEDVTFDNCYYLKDATESDNPRSPVTGKLLPDMATDEFAGALGLNWTRADQNNNGLPYLTEMPIPKQAPLSTMTVSIAIATYDKNAYEFARDGEVLRVTLPTSGNTCVIDVMDAAVSQGLMTYDYTITPAYGSFIEAINGNKMASPDGWMFTVNDQLSDVSATIAKVEDGDQVLWYQGTTQNLFAPPSWKDITGEKPKIEWVDIDSVEKLVALTSDDCDLTLNYRLTKDLDLEGVDFRGIGSVSKPFSGTFDGGGHEIAHLTINRPEDHNIGFFNFIKGANIRNLNLTGIDVTGKYSVGGMIGVADVELNVNDRTSSIGNNIGNCRVSGIVASTNEDQTAASDGSYTGGFIGFNDGETDSKTQISIFSSIHNCRADVQVNAGSHYSGGFCGGNYGYITDSKVTGTVTGARFTGGFLGGNEGGIYDSSSETSVSGRDYIGGFVGSTNGTIMRCYSTGDVTGTIERNGGFLGAGSGTVKGCTSAGTVKSASGVSYVGGFAGYYTGTLSGHAPYITYADNHGWCVNGTGDALSAIANKKSSQSDAEQAVLDDNCVTDWEKLQEKFLSKHGVILTDTGDIVIPKKNVDLDKVAGAIYESLDKPGAFEELTPWVIADMAVHDRLTGSESAITEKRKQEIVDSIASAVQERDARGNLAVTAADLAKDIIALRAMGLDPRQIMLAGDENEKLDLVAMLKSKVAGDGFAEEGIFVQPYVLIALSQDPGYATDAEISGMIEEILKSEAAAGGFGSADATGPVVMALAMHMGNSEVDAAVSKALDVARVTSEMDENGAVKTSFAGAYQNATSESTAQMLVAIAAAGRNPEDYKVGDATIVSGLKAFVDDEEKGFKHDYAGTGNKTIATEQGLRGILANKIAAAGGGVLYDFSGVSVEPAKSNVEKVKDFEEILDEARRAAKAAIDEEMAKRDIPASLIEEMEQKKAEAVSAIESSEDLDGILEIVQKFAADMDDRISEKKEEERAAAEEAKKKALEDRKESARGEIEKYLLDNRDKLDKAKGAAVVLDSALELMGAKSLEEVDAVVEKAKKNLDKLISDKAAADEKAKADAKKYGDVDSLTPSDATLNEKAKTDKKLNIKANSITTSARAGKKTMTVKWKKVSGATNYRIAYKKAGAKKWTYKWSAGKNSVVLTKMTDKGLYEFKLQAVKKAGSTWTKSSFSKSNYRYYAITKQTVKAGKKSVTVKVKKVKGATGYQVLYSTKKNMKGAKIKYGKKPTVKVSKLKKGKKYYLQVRPVKKYKGKTYVGILSSAGNARAR